MNVSQVSALKKHVVGNLTAVTHPDGLIGGEPVSTVSPQCNSLPAHRAIADDIAFVRIAIQITVIGIEKASLRSLNQSRQVGVGSFHSKIKVLHHWYVREV